MDTKPWPLQISRFCGWDAHASFASALFSEEPYPGKPRTGQGKLQLILIPHHLHPHLCAQWWDPLTLWPAQNQSGKAPQTAFVLLPAGNTSAALAHCHLHNHGAAGRAQETCAGAGGTQVTPMGSTALPLSQKTNLVEQLEQCLAV